MYTVIKLLDRIYTENDFARGVATSLSGSIGLIVYLVNGDLVIAVFSAIITFPIARLFAVWGFNTIHTIAERQKADDLASLSISKLSDEELEVVSAFVTAGGCVLTWSQINRLDISGPAVESLMQRGFLSTSMTADAMHETFVLDTALFDMALLRSKNDRI